jgi:hypothetical protein
MAVITGPARSARVSRAAGVSLRSVFTQVRKGLLSARSALLTLSGFASITASVWTAFGVAAGLASLGVTFLVIEYLSREENT